MTVRQYQIGAIGTVVARVSAILAGFASLWILTRVLSKPEFGAYGYASALFHLLALLPSLGLERAILYRMSRSDRAPLGDLVEGGAVRQAILVTSLIAALMGLAVILAADRIAAATMPGSAVWLRWMAPTLLGVAVGAVMAAWFRARGRMAAATLMPYAGEVFKPVLFAVVWVSALGLQGVAIATSLAYLLPLVVWWYLTPRAAWATRDRLARSDYAFGLKMLFSNFTNILNKQLGILLLGFFGAAAATGDFLLAIALAIAADMGREVLVQAAMPSLARKFKAGERPGLALEFDLTRRIGFALSLMAGLGYFLVGPFALGLFGEYRTAIDALLILWAGFTLQVAAGFSTPYLAMSGRAGWTLIVTFAALVVQIVTSVLLIPVHGAAGAAFGLAASIFVTKAIGIAVIWRLDRFSCLTWRAVAAFGIAAVPVVPILSGVIPLWSGSIGTFLAMAVLAKRGDWALIRGQIDDAARTLRSMRARRSPDSDLPGP